MYIAFAFAGIVGILTQCKFQIPVGLDYFLLYLSLFNEGLLFYTHAGRVSTLDQYIHYILLIPIFSGAVCSLLEVWLRNNPVLELFRTSMFITQGTWMWQIGYVLYPLWEAPSWDHNDQKTLSFMAMCYCWHCQSTVLFLSIIYGIVYWFLRSQKGGFEGTENEIQKFNQDDTKTYTALLDGSDEE
ncbi:transmembrane protein 45B-like [Sceloporus undulatus]|uniref:transmembrane protein 45B-like n=1 Tax=Sceloporus undulatus TaxID=8520 RepID=UPI001C4B3BEC|nr:transmembrane protein 45B-like [Sceloporus undulatus]